MVFVYDAAVSDGDSGEGLSAYAYYTVMLGLVTVLLSEGMLMLSIWNVQPI